MKSPLRWAVQRLDHVTESNRIEARSHHETENTGRSQLYIRCLGAIGPEAIRIIVDRQDRSG